VSRSEIRKSESAVVSPREPLQRLPCRKVQSNFTTTVPQSAFWELVSIVVQRKAAVHPMPSRKVRFSSGTGALHTSPSTSAAPCLLLPGNSDMSGRAVSGGRTVCTVSHRQVQDWLAAIVSHRALRELISTLVPRAEALQPMSCRQVCSRSGADALRRQVAADALIN
jgi:hypothetical protein